MNRLTILSVILIIFTLGAWGINIGVSLYLGASTDITAEQLTFYGTLSLYMRLVNPVILNIIIGIWLFVSAKKTNYSPWIWALLGLSFSLLAVVLFFCVQILEKTASTAKPEESGDL